MKKEYKTIKEAVGPLMMVECVENVKYYEIVEIKVEEDSDHIGKRINDILSDEADINLLFINRGDEKIRKGCGNEKLKAGDIAVLYGDANAIREHFQKDKIVDKAT